MAVLRPDDLAADGDIPRQFSRTVTRGDRIFRGVSAGAATMCLVIIGATAVFLTWSAIPAIQENGLSFFTSSVWNASVGEFGVGGLLVGTIIIASVALVIAVPLALGLAL